MARLGLTDFVKMVCKRQKLKEADTFVIIYGLARTGKTTLGFRLLLIYFWLKRKLFKKGLSDWLPERRWSEHFKRYFATTAEDMNYKIKHNPEGSYTFVDEGADVASWHEILTKEQKDLIELILKSGKKKQFTILITASFKILTKSLLARAHYLFIITEEPTINGNGAFLFKNYTIPFLAETNFFGLNKLFKDLEKNSWFIEESNRFNEYLKRQKRLIGKVHFGKINERLYNLYDILVKDPSIMRDKRKRQVVSFALYSKLKYFLDTLLYNLYVKDSKSIAQIQKLLMDKFGSSLATRQLIENHINKMTALEVKPKLSETEILEKPVEVSASEDLDVDLGFKEFEGEGDAEKKPDKSKDKADTS
jgi:hypothetical protein